MRIAVIILTLFVVIAMAGCQADVGKAVNTVDTTQTDTTAARYISEAQYLVNKQKQVHDVALILNELGKLHITADTLLRLEYFFHTNTMYKAAELAQATEELGYRARCVRSIDHSYVVNGWTPPLPMQQAIITQWVTQMCDLGYQYDCDLTGWGTTPAQ